MEEVLFGEGEPVVDEGLFISFWCVLLDVFYFGREEDKDGDGGGDESAAAVVSVPAEVEIPRESKQSHGVSTMTASPHFASLLPSFLP